MSDRLFSLVDKLACEHRLDLSEYEELIRERNAELIEYTRQLALAERQKHYSDKVFIRGLIEISNICKNGCFYCGINRANSECSRYRLTKEQILECCDEGYALGFRTFVMQGGEDPYFTDEVVCDIVSAIKRRYPNCAVTLSLGEKSRESYRKLREAGADRYLLRHETVDEAHYSLLHPEDMSLSTRMECLKSLKELGFQTGCGFMVGSPYQTEHHIAKDLKFIEEFQPEMCGIGPFIPHKATRFASFDAGSVELSCYLLSIVRLIAPTVLLPATTALGSLEDDGREKGILSGANVVMPNLSPADSRKKYELYDNKLYTNAESAQAIKELEERMKAIGYRIVCDKGDAKKHIN